MKSPAKDTDPILHNLINEIFAKTQSQAHVLPQFDLLDNSALHQPLARYNWTWSCGYAQVDYMRGGYAYRPTNY